MSSIRAWMKLVESGMESYRIFHIRAKTPLYFATTVASKRGKPADGPEILTPQWLRQYGSPILSSPISEAYHLLERFLQAPPRRSDDPRLLRFLTTRNLSFLDRDSIPEQEMDLDLLSADRKSHPEVLASNRQLHGFVRYIDRRDCFIFEVTDPINNLILDRVIRLPKEKGEYSELLASDPPLSPLTTERN